MFHEKPTPGPKLPFPLKNHCVVWLEEKKLLVTGGISAEDKTQDQLILIDLGTNSAITLDSSPMLTARAYHGCAAFGRRMVVAGGFGDQSNSVEMFTYINAPSDGSWQALTPLPEPRIYLTLKWSKTGSLIVAGGYNKNLPESIALLNYNWREDQWVKWEQNSTRRQHSSLILSTNKYEYGHVKLRV